MKYKITMATIALLAIFSNQAFADGGNGKGINQGKINQEVSIESEQGQKQQEATKSLPSMPHGDKCAMSVKSGEAKN